MAKADATWKVFDHSPILALADNLWWVSGSLPSMSLRRTMTVIRLHDGRLVVHNPIAMDDASMARLDAWGSVDLVVVPNAYHRLDSARFKARYPNARFAAPSGSKKKIEEVVAIDLTFDQYQDGDTSLRFESLDGVADREGALVVESNDGVSIILNDAMFNMDKKSDFMGNLVTTVLGSAPGPRVSRLAKLALVADRKALRAKFEGFAQIPHLQRVIVAHEKIAVGDAASASLRKAATFL